MTDSPAADSLLIPVICDRCRATGMAGDSAFAAIPDILDFDPVPRRAHVNNWTPEHQRAFIAALAITGSPRQAARVLGRHMFGAQQLRSARGGKEFAAAWDAAMELARDREFARIHANLSALSAERAAGDAVAPGSVPGLAGGAIPRPVDPFAAGSGPGDPADEQDLEDREYREARIRIRDRLTRARRLLLMGVAGNPANRAAWEQLVGPVDWDRAVRGESQADEPFADPELFDTDKNPHRFANPDMLLTAEAGLLPELTGGHDALAPLRAALLASESEGKRQAANDDGEAPPPTG